MHRAHNQYKMKKNERKSTLRVEKNKNVLIFTCKQQKS